MKAHIIWECPICGYKIEHRGNGTPEDNLLATIKVLQQALQHIDIKHPGALDLKSSISRQLSALTEVIR